MIKLVDNFKDYNIKGFDDVFFYRIMSDFNTIRQFDNVDFYVSLIEDDVTAVMSKVNGVITISAADNADFQEINEFVKVIGFTTILCDEKFSSSFIGKKTSGKILKLSAGKSFSSDAELLDTNNLKEIYRVLKRVFKRIPDFSDWFVNTCYGMMHNSVMSAGICTNGKIVSVAFMLFISEKAAVLSAVATLPEYRNRGFAMQIVKKLLNENKDKDIFLFLENPLLEEYYAELGFSYCKMWSETENVI